MLVLAVLQDLGSIWDGAAAFTGKLWLGLPVCSCSCTASWLSNSHMLMQAALQEPAHHLALYCWTYRRALDGAWDCPGPLQVRRLLPQCLPGTDKP